MKVKRREWTLKDYQPYFRSGLILLEDILDANFVRFLCYLYFFFMYSLFAKFMIILIMFCSFLPDEGVTHHTTSLEAPSRRITRSMSRGESSIQSPLSLFCITLV